MNSKKDWGMCIWNKKKKCNGCVDRPKPFSINPRDLYTEVNMGYGFRLARGYELLEQGEMR